MTYTFFYDDGDLALGVKQNSDQVQVFSRADKQLAIELVDRDGPDLFRLP